LVIDGDPVPNRSVARRFALPIDLESGARGDVLSLGLADLSDRAPTSLGPCRSADADPADAWFVDVPLPRGVALHLDASKAAADVGFTPSLARLRFTDNGHSVCVVRLAAFGGSLSPSEGHRAVSPGSSPSATRSALSLPLVVHGRGERTTFSCSAPSAKR
jgi:hypothetical protein